MKTVSSRSNPLYKKLSALAADAREQRKHGLTLLDGPHLVDTYRRQVGLPETLVVSESGCANPEVVRLIAAHTGVEPVLLGDSLFTALSGVSTPVGIFSVIHIPAEPGAFAGGNCVLLDAVQDAGNVGSILRTAAAAGVHEIFLGAGCAGAWSPRVLRAAQGAHFRLRIHEKSDLAAVLGAFQGTSLATVIGNGISIHEADLRGDLAWLFGNEGCGINPSLSALADHVVTIPLAADTESLNVAAAAAVCLFMAADRKVLRR